MGSSGAYTFCPLAVRQSCAKPSLGRPANIKNNAERQVKDNIIERVDVMSDPIEWASPLVIQPKKNGKVRICADFKATINKYIKEQIHPLPTLNVVADEFAGFTEFSLIDLKDAYHQLLVALCCRKYLVVATEWGYFRYKCLPFGISIGPMLFQRFMDTLLADIEGVVCVQDDIALGGRNRADHLQRLNKVLSRLQEVGLRVSAEKLKLLQPSIIFLGHLINAEGIHPLPQKVCDFASIPSPTNVSELRSFLGSINQYGRFVPNLLPMCQPLHRLLKKNVSWNWTNEDQALFDRLKLEITSDRVLVHYDPQLPLVLSCDASEKGVGAVLQHRYPDDTLRPIMAASRTLTVAESNYSSIDCEALAILFGVGKFYKYLYGRHFYLLTDHKPLERIFGEKSEIPKLAASRLVRWAIQLSAFNYTLLHVPGEENCAADVLSRFPRKERSSEFEQAANLEINQIQTETVEHLTLTRKLLRMRTEKDKVLSRVMYYVTTSWPARHQIDKELHAFFDRKDQLFVEKGILLCGACIVIPQSLRLFVLSKLHETHPGVNATNSLARLTVWWPHLDSELEKYVKSCVHCQTHSPKEPPTPLNLWNTPERVWERIHIDFTGPYDGLQWFVVIDAFSRWLEIFPMPSATASGSINVLRSLFARYGIPRQIVSDNGSQFRSQEFRDFCKNNGSRLIFTTPYHSRSNGLVERSIRTFKWRYNKSAHDIQDRCHRLQALLFVYRNSEHSTTGRCPAELFLGRRLPTIFDRIRPDVRATIDENQFLTKMRYDEHTRSREFKPGQAVYYKRPVDAVWSPTTIAVQTTPLSYTTSDGKRLHADHLKDRTVVFNDDIETAHHPDDTPEVPDSTGAPPPKDEESGSMISVVPRRSARVNKGCPPNRFSL
jgi:transposase InsO family protein